MSKNLLLSVLFLTSTTLLAQDPTLPSAALLERMQGHSTTQSLTDNNPAPSIKVKAIVMRDNDHGSATLESNGSLYRVMLCRQNIDSSTHAAPTTYPQIQIDGTSYFVHEFNETTIVLSNGLQRILVQ